MKQLRMFGNDEITHVVGLSGGKDSTAMALRLRELNPDTPYTYIITPTGDELPEMIDHWNHLQELLGMKLTPVTCGKSLNGLIKEQNAMPSFNMRWCTRILKIEPMIAYLNTHYPAINYVGLRADEPLRQGIYGADVECVYPLREWGWGIAEVMDYLKERGVKIPARTDCARCYGQRLGEWEALYRNHPDIYADAERQESEIGHTFRSPGRDTKPAALIDLRAYFDSKPPTEPKVDEDDKHRACRVCRF